MTAFKSAFAIAAIGLVLAGGAAILMPQPVHAATSATAITVSSDGDSTGKPQPATDDEPAVQVAGALR